MSSMCFRFGLFQAWLFLYTGIAKCRMGPSDLSLSFQFSKARFWGSSGSCFFPPMWFQFAPRCNVTAIPSSVVLLSMWPHQIHPKNALLHKEADLIILEGFKLINGLCHWDMPLLSWCAIPKVTSTVCSSPAFSSLLLERNIFSKILEKLYLQTSVSESPLKLTFQEEKKM